MSDGTLIFDTQINTSGFDKGTKALESKGTSAFKNIASVISAAAIGKALVDFGKKAVDLASDLDEVQNVVDVTFADSAEKINEWAKKSASAFGLTELTAKQYAGTMGAMLKSSGVATESLEEMSLALTALAGDFASFYNINSDEAFAKIRAGISGETEPLKQLGINMSVANMEAYALQQGLEKTWEEMGQGEKVMLRYQYLMDQTSDSQGDFTRTSDSFANTMRIIEMNFTQLSASIGAKLLPKVKEASYAIRDFSEGLTDSFKTAGFEGSLAYLQKTFPIITAAAKGFATTIGVYFTFKGVAAIINGIAAANAAWAAAMALCDAEMIANVTSMSVANLAYGALTGKISMASAAQLIFNRLVDANKFLVIATAIGVVVGSIALFSNAMLKSNEEMYQTKLETIALKESIKELNEEAKNAEKSFRQNDSQLSKNLDVNKSMVDELFEMSEAYEKTSYYQAAMQSICDSLNSSIEGLNVSFNAQTGAINQSKEALKAYIESAAEAEREQMQAQRYAELLEQRAEALYNLKAAEEAYASRKSGKVDLGSFFQMGFNLKDAQTAYDEAGTALANYKGYLDEYLNSAKDAAGASEDLGNAISNSIQTEEEKKKIEELTDALQKYKDMAQNLFEPMETETETTVSDMIDNLETNVEAMTGWKEAIEKLTGKIPEEMREALLNLGPQDFSAEVIKLATATPEQLKQISDSWTEAGTAAVDAFKLAMTGKKEGEENPNQGLLEDLINQEKLVEKTEEAFAAATEAITKVVSEADLSKDGESIVESFTGPFEELAGKMKEYGEQAINGLVAGINSKIGEVKDALSNVASAASKTFTLKMEIKSPSKLFKRYGEYVTEGFSRGIKSGIGDVSTAMDKMSNAVSRDWSGGYNSGVYESVNAAQGEVGGTVRVTQNIYAQKQSPAEIMREAQWMQKRAVMMGV